MRSAVHAWKLANVLVISVSGNLTGSLPEELEEHLLSAYDDDFDVIVDLAKAAYLGPDALASLLHAAVATNTKHRKLLLAEVPQHLQRVIKAARLMHCFVTAPTVVDAMYRITKSESRLPPERVAFGGPAAAARTIHVQVELLQDSCERIVAAGQVSQFAFGPHSSSAPTAR